MLPEAVEGQCTVGMHVEQGVAVVLRATSFDHRRQSEIVNTLELLVVIDVIVSLEDSQNGARFFQHAAHRRCIANNLRR